MTYRPPQSQQPYHGDHYAPPAPRSYEEAENHRHEPGSYQYKYLQPPTRRGRKGPWRWLRRVVLAAVVGLLVICIGVMVLQQYVASQIVVADVREDQPAAKLLTQPANILLLGVDLRPDQPQEGVRSDTLLLLHLDPVGGWGSLVSIPRDSVATIPGFGDTKINAAFSHGYANAEQLYGPGTDPTAAGIALAADTVEQFLGLPQLDQRIDYVATINFDGFAQMIDAMGTITVDVPSQIIDTAYPTEDFGTTTIQFDPGPQQMDGERALQYVRTRHADSDFGRGQRQQQVVQAIVQELRNKPFLVRPITALQLALAADEAVQTTLPVGRPDALLMGLFATRIDPDRLATYPINPETARVQERGSDLVWDHDDVLAITERALQPPDPVAEPAAEPAAEPEQVTIQVQNGAGVPGIAAQASDLLQRAGFTVAAPDNAARTDRSQIVDYGQHSSTRQRLTSLLSGIPVVERPAEEAPDGVNLVIVIGTDYTTYLDKE